MNRATPVALALALLAGGCGGIDIKAVGATQQSVSGVPWNLAMTQYKITITRQITGCTGQVTGVVLIAATPLKALDDEQRYSLSSSGIWATSDITSSLATDGTSTGLNAHSENQAGAVITNVVSAVAQIAALSGDNNKSTIACSDKVRKAFDVLTPNRGKKLKDQVEDETAALAKATANVTRLTTEASLDKSYQPKLIKALDAQYKAQQSLTDDQAKLAANLKKVQDVQTVIWPLHASDIRADKPYKLPPTTLDGWLTLTGYAKGDPPDSSQFDVFFALYAPDGRGGWKAPDWTVSGGAAPRGDTSIGVPVRVGGIGRLLGCTKVPCPAALADDWIPKDLPTEADTSNDANDANKAFGPNVPPVTDQNAPLPKLLGGEIALIQPDQTVLQFGTMYNVAVRGGMFKSEGAVITLDANGAPTSIETSEKTAAAVAATSAAQSIVQEAAALPGQVAAARLARTQAATAQLNANGTFATAQANAATATSTATANAQTTLLTAQNNLATARANATNAGEVGQLAAQTAEINAQNALAQAESNAANDDATVKNRDQIDALQSQTALLSAQAAQINAEVAVRTAQALLAKP